MAKYLVSLSYTAEGAKGVRKDGGTKRRAVAAKAVESLGGTLESMYFTLGKSDVVVIVDMPTPVAVAALSLAIASTGAAHLSTTTLLTPEEIDQATAKKTAYRAPGA